MSKYTAKALQNHATIAWFSLYKNGFREIYGSRFFVYFLLVCKVIKVTLYKNDRRTFVT